VNVDTEMEALQGEANKAEEEWDSEKRGVTEEMMKNRGKPFRWLYQQECM